MTVEEARRLGYEQALVDVEEAFKARKEEADKAAKEPNDTAKAVEAFGDEQTNAAEERALSAESWRADIALKLAQAKLVGAQAKLANAKAFSIEIENARQSIAAR